MSDNQKRIVCRLLFIVCCVVPTAIVLKWIFTPPTTMQWESHIKSHLGLITKIENVHTPLPQETILENVRALDIAKNRPIELGTITIANTEKGRSVILQDLGIQNYTLANLLKRIHMQVSESRDLARPYAIYLKQATIHSTDFNNQKLVQSLHNILIQVIPGERRLELSIKFKLQPDAESPYIQLTHVRLLESKPDETWALNASQSSIPAWLLADIVPELDCLGSHASFTGVIRLERSGRQWDGFCRGKLTHVDLFHLVQRPFNRWAYGLADIQIESCQIQNGKITHIQGQFKCKEGQVGTDLIQSLAHAFQLGAPHLDPLGTKIDFQVVHFGFQIEKNKINLRGDAGGTIMYSTNNDQFLIVDQGAWHPVANLIKALGESSLSVPITSRAMSEYLQLASLNEEDLLAVPYVGQITNTDDRDKTFFE